MWGRRGAGWTGALGLATLCLLLCVPASFAAAPANDDFENAQALSSALPVEVTGTTMESTPEADEPVPDGFEFATSGRTVWFEWEATNTGFVTVSTCGSQVSNVLGIYTGTEVDALTEVAGGFSSLGPDCTTFRGTAVTFKALSGVTYDLLLEGRPTFSEEAAPGEGSFTLKLAATPVPPNDDFADATVLNGQILENGVYAAGASGYSWNASKEPGEPQHASDPGGASVWYSWTAPSTGDFTVSSCGRFATVLGIYTGGLVGALNQVLSRRGCGISVLPAVAGVTYHLAFDGELDSGTWSAAMGTLWVNVSRLPATTPTPAPYESIVEREFQLQVSPPRTTIRMRSLKPAKGRATFAFSSDEPDSTFRCQIDRKSFRRCASPKAYRDLKPGQHVFKVTATDAAGNVDPTPAVVRFTFPKARPRSD